MIKINIDFKWEPVLENETANYLFPNVISNYMKERYKFPAIYRWLVYQGSKLESVYIGETKELCPERISNYLNSDSSMQTNFRIKNFFIQQIKKGKKIHLERLMFSAFKFNDKNVNYQDLSEKSTRILLEHVMITYHKNEGIELLNKE